MYDGTWYRCEVERTAHWNDEYDYVEYYTERVVWRTYHVVRNTPKGVWVREDHPCTETRFVLGTANNQLCVPTPELAISDEIIRRQYHVHGAKARLERAEKMLACVNREVERMWNVKANGL